MIEVKIIDIMPNDALAIVNDLKQRGYLQGLDYDWEYHKPRYSDSSYELEYNRYTIFKFYKEELATWFSLRYL